MNTKMENFKIVEAIKIAEIESLKNELINEIKNCISGEIEVTVKDWATYIDTDPNNRNNKFSIYHNIPYGSTSRKYEINWFSSTLNVGTDEYGYGNYLIILGQIVNAMKKGLKDVFEFYLNKIENIQAEISELRLDLEMEIREAQLKKVKDMICDNVGKFQMKCVIDYKKSNRTKIEYNKLSYIKQKNNFNVFLGLDGLDSVKIIMQENDLVNYLLSNLDSIESYS